LHELKLHDLKGEVYLPS